MKGKWTSPQGKRLPYESGAPPRPFTPSHFPYPSHLCYNEGNANTVRLLMKKFLFLLLILCGAMYWGFSSGSELTKNVVHEPVKPHAVQKAAPKDTQPSEEKGILTEISDTVSTLVSGLSSTKTQEGSIEAQPPKPDAKSPVTGTEKLLTAKEKLDNVLHFREALEARVHREEFVPFAEIPDYLDRKSVV